jgi:hypothetical protein
VSFVFTSKEISISISNSIEVSIKVVRCVLSDPDSRALGLHEELREDRR